MSEPIRIAVVAEGPTDGIVIRAAIASVLGGQPFIFKQLQPEESQAFGRLQGGWVGVYHWCRQAVERAGGSVANDPLFASYDILIVHLDSDVAKVQYADGGILDPVNDLPCVRPCPPAHDTTNRLRAVMTRWVGGLPLPSRLVWCTPSLCTETWVLAALYQGDPAVTAGTLEWHPDPHLRLQAKPLNGRLVTGGKKITKMYRSRSPEITEAWPKVRRQCSEAERFSFDTEKTQNPG
jgi:hypothetical protein